MRVIASGSPTSGFVSRCHNPKHRAAAVAVALVVEMASAWLGLVVSGGSVQVLGAKMRK